VARSYPEILAELARENADIYAISIDSWGHIAQVADEFPERAIEVGIAEQNAVGVAAGLALCGKIPFVHGMVPFVTMRSFEQVRTDIGYPHLNVKVVGAYSGGLELAAWGATHHGVEDIALMRLIPGMTVVIPADAWETEQAMRAIAGCVGPAYIRLAGGELEPSGSQRDFELGRASRLRDGSDLTLISAGAILSEAIAAVELLAQEGVSVRLLSMHTVKPLDREAVLCAAAETRGVITLEEHTVVGGLGAAVAEALAEQPLVPTRRLGLQDVFISHTGPREDLLRIYHMTAEAVVEAAHELLDNGSR